MGAFTRTWTTSGSAQTTATACRRRCATSAPPGTSGPPSRRLPTRIHRRRRRHLQRRCRQQSSSRRQRRGRTQAPRPQLRGRQAKGRRKLMGRFQVLRGHCSPPGAQRPPGCHPRRHWRPMHWARTRPPQRRSHPPWQQAQLATKRAPLQSGMPQPQPPTGMLCPMSGLPKAEPQLKEPTGVCSPLPEASRRIAPRPLSCPSAHPRTHPAARSISQTGRGAAEATAGAAEPLLLQPAGYSQSLTVPPPPAGEEAGAQERPPPGALAADATADGDPPPQVAAGRTVTSSAASPAAVGRSCSAVTCSRDG